MLPLSVLDQSVNVAGRPQAQAIRDTVELAKLAETLGYARFWVSEHHNHPSILGTAPEILIAALAPQTSRIRLGSAGVMLPHYSPFKVAEQFRVLDALAPGRIDLGLGRAPGSDGLTAYALHPMADKRSEQFPSDVRDLMAWVSGRPLIEGHPFAKVRAYPEGETSPEVWMLGSSDFGAQVAAHFGLPYSFAWFFTDGRGGAEALALYRERYKPSARHPKPHAGLCVFALACETAEEARRQFFPRARWRLYRDQGIFLPLESPEAAAAHEYTEAERKRLDWYFADALIGTGAEVAAKIQAMAAAHQCAEMAVVTWAFDPAVQRRSYELLAEAWGMKA